MNLLVPVLVGGGILAILAFSKGASAQTRPGSGGGGGGSGGGGGGSGGGGGGSGGGGGGDTGGGSGAGDGSGGLVPGQIDPATGTTYMGPGGSDYPLSATGTTLGYDQGAPGAVSSGTTPSLWDSLTSAITGAPMEGWHFSEHPHVLAVTGGRGGWVPDYPGCYEGFAPPSGLPVH